MLVVLLTHPGDRYLAVPLCDRIQALGGVQNHECLIVSPAGTQMDGIENTLRRSFGNVWTHSYPETMRGWPYGPNEAAAEAILHVFANPALRYHYLMLEPDCVPMTRNWLDVIDMAYRRCGQQMMGVRLDTVEIGTNKVVGRHTVGVAVYPKNFPQLCPLVKSLRGMSDSFRRTGAMAPPWDAYFGPYTAKITADTDLIQHLPRVAKRRQDQSLIWDCPTTEIALSQVDRRAVLVHGCKDPAFMRSVSGVTAPPIPVVPVVVAPAPEVPRGTIPVPQEPASQPGDYVKPNKVRERQLREAEEIRIKLGIKWALNSPEGRRAVFFHTNPKMTWAQIRHYAGKLGLSTMKKKKGDVINAIVEKEKEQGKEAWVKALPVAAPEPPPAPPIPVAAPQPAVPIEQQPVAASNGTSNVIHTAVQWKPVDAQGRMIDPDPPKSGANDIFPPEMVAKMMKLRAERNLTGATV